MAGNYKYKDVYSQKKKMVLLSLDQQLASHIKKIQDLHKKNTGKKVTRTKIIRTAIAEHVNKALSLG